MRVRGISFSRMCILFPEYDNEVCVCWSSGQRPGRLPSPGQRPGKAKPQTLKGQRSDHLYAATSQTAGPLALFPLVWFTSQAVGLG